MVWQYGVYSSWHCLVDYSKGESVSCLYLPPGKDPREEKVKGRRVIALNPESGERLSPIEKMLEHAPEVPIFWMFSNNPLNRSLCDLNLASPNGLKKYIRSSHSITDGKISVIELKNRPRPISFEDFKDVASYFVERFPRIAREVVLPTEDLTLDISPADRAEINKYRARCLEVLDWPATQREICWDFGLDLIVAALMEDSGLSRDQARQIEEEVYKVVPELKKSP